MFTLPTKSTAPTKTAPQTKATDDTDDDPSVWSYYSDGLAAANEWLQGAISSEEVAEVDARADLMIQWIDAIEADSRMRRADVLALCELVGASSSTTRSGAIANLRKLVLKRQRDARQIAQAAASRPW